MSKLTQFPSLASCGTPGGITGVLVPPKAVAVSVTWLTCTFKCIPALIESTFLPRLRFAYLSHTFDEIVDTSFSFRGYKNGERTLFGACIAWTPGREDCLLSISQTALEKLYPDEQIVLFNSLYSMGCTVTRIDLACDDYSGDFTVDKMRSALRAGHYVGRNLDTQDFERRKISTGQRLSNGLSIGSRSSEVYIRCYDKGLESKGKQLCHRLEMELKGDTAHSAFVTLLSSLSSILLSNGEIRVPNVSLYSSVIAGMILSKIDLRDRNSNARVNRRVRLDWWASFMDKVSKIAIVQPIKHDSLDKTREWFQRAIAPTLALLIESAGEDACDWLEFVVKQGRERYSKRHLTLLRKVGM